MAGQTSPGKTNPASDNPPRPAYWQVEPEEYLGVDPRGRHYWLLKSNVYRTTDTGDRGQSTSWVSCEAPFRTLGVGVHQLTTPGTPDPESSCRIRLYDTPELNQGHGFATIVVCTEPPGPSGNSVTNAAEHLAAEVMDKHRLSNMVWIEHYDRGRQPRTAAHPAPDHDYSLVTFSLDKHHDRLISGRWHKTLGEPSWKHLTNEQVETLLGDLAPHLEEEDRARHA